MKATRANQFQETEKKFELRKRKTGEREEEQKKGLN